MIEMKFPPSCFLFEYTDSFIRLTNAQRGFLLDSPDPDVDADSHIFQHHRTLLEESTDVTGPSTRPSSGSEIHFLMEASGRLLLPGY